MNEEKYRCKKSFSIYYYDECEDCIGRLTIEENTIFTLCETDFRVVGGDDTVRLSNDKNWVEITKSHLNDWFEKI